MRYTLFKRIFFLVLVLAATLGVGRAQIYQIGDVYIFPDSSKGIICYVNPDNPVEGWAVALNDVGWVSKLNNQQYYMLDAGCTLPSGMVSHPYDAENGIGRYGLSTWSYEGKNNTRLLLESGQSPAAEAVDFYNGWYIPDAVQMRHIFGLIPFIESAIIEAGGDVDNMKWMYEYNGSHGHDYWTSTRVNNNQMLVIRGSQYFYAPRTPADHNQAINSERSTQNRIRAVRDFGTDAYAYWVDKPKSASMQVSPTENTSYDAYVIFNSDTIRVTSSAIVHETYDKDTLYEVVCSSPNPYTSVVNPIFTNLDISHAHDYLPNRVTLQTVHGCDSVITLMLKVNQSHLFSQSATICQSNLPYLWRGHSYTETGVYYDSLKTVCCNCDSVYELNLTVIPLPEVTFNPIHPALCFGNSIELSASALYCSDFSAPIIDNLEGVLGNNVEITTRLATLTDLFKSGVKVFSGGDGVVRLGNSSTYGKIVSKPLDLSSDFILDLRLKGWIRNGSSEPAATRVRVSVDNIYADTITVPGSNETVPGDFDTYSFSFGPATASSTITIEALNEVAPGSPYAEERVFIDFMRITNNSPCDFEWYDGSSLLSHDASITVSPVETKKYYVETTSGAGCKNRDSIEVDVHNHYSIDTFATACNSFVWHGETLTTSGNYVHNFVCHAGCDSIVTLHLTLGHSNTGDTTATACNSFTWYGQTYTTTPAIAPTHTFTNASGCDSVVTLHLTIGHSNTGDTSAFACNSFTWYGTTYTDVPAIAPTRTFTNASGCDSVVTLHLTMGYSNTGDTTAFDCNSFTWYGTTYTETPAVAPTHTFTNASGCDSVVTLHLTIGAVIDGDTMAHACDSFTWNGITYKETPAIAPTRMLKTVLGCDSIVTLHLTVGHSNTGDTTAVACNSFTWYGTTYTETPAIAPTHTFTNASGCDSVVTLHLTVNYSNTGDTTAVACDSFDWYEYHGITSSTESLTHTFTNASGCDSVVTLHLTVNYSNTGDTTAVACNSFTWYGTTYAETPAVAPTHTFTNASGCDSVVTLHLTVNYSSTGDTTAFACDSFDWYEHTGITSSTESLTHTFTNASGCDSVVTLHLTVGHSNTGDTTASACNSFTWYGTTYTETPAIAPTHTFTNASGCDSVVTLHLTVGHSNTGDTTAFACVSFTWHGITYTETPAIAPKHTYTNASGCDSVVTLHLNIGAVVYGDTTAHACNSFTWYGTTYTETPAVAPMRMLKNVDGCDSLVTLHLTVGHSNTGDTTAFACNSFTWYGTTYTSTPAIAPTHTFTNASGCDSVVTLHLTVGHSNTGDTTAFACNSFTWYGTTYTSTPAVAPTHTFTNASGCDSVVTLHLTVGHSNTGDTTAFACNSFTWYGTTYTSTPVVAPKHTFTNASGCDSVVTLKLTVGHSNTGDTTAFACNSFTWYGTTYTSTPAVAPKHTFTNASGCDSVVTLHLTVGHSNTGDTTAFACDSFDWYEHTNITSSTETLTHTFKNASGCDSVVTLHLTVGHSNTGDTTAFACDHFDWYEHLNITSSTDALTHTFTNASGCDSVVTLHLTVGHSNTGDTTAFACDSFDWYEHTNITSSTNSLTHTFTNASGCDSVVTLKLTVGHSNTGDTIASGCDSFDWYEHTNITSSCDNLTHTFKNASGCDSVVTLHLTMGYTNTGDTLALACETFDWYEHHNITSSTNSLTHTFTNASGCDSVVTLNLIVHHPVHESVTRTACDSYYWNGTTYYTSGTYTYSHLCDHGCIQVDTLHLTINHTTYGDTSAVECRSFTWHGITYNKTPDTDPTYTIVGGNHKGCDSVVTLHLTILPAYTINLEEIVHSGTHFPFLWNGINITGPGNYTYTTTASNGCDSVVKINFVTEGCNIQVNPIVSNEICGNDGTIAVEASGGYSQLYYSVNAGVDFYTDSVFTNMPAGFHVVVVHDDLGCFTVGYAFIHPSHGLTISCAPDVYDTLSFGDCFMNIPSADIQEPTINSTNTNVNITQYPPNTVSGTWKYPTLADWPAYTVTNDIPLGNMFGEGDNVITWTVNDAVCGPRSCQQHVYVTFPKCPNAIDCEGNVYQGIRIDCDCWTQTNLKSTRYSDCSLIPTVYEYYSRMTPNVEENVERFGRLYSFESAVRDSADNGHGHIQGVCPAGWYLPTPGKFDTLATHGADALKSPLYWLDGGGSNTTGFSALPAGWYNGDKDRFEGMYGETYFWSTEGVKVTAHCYAYGLMYKCDELFETDRKSGVGYSVRCVKEKR